MKMSASIVAQYLAVQRRLRTMQGQAMTEYIVVIMVGVIVLILATSGQPSVIDQMIAALKTFWKNFSYMISLP